MITAQEFINKNIPATCIVLPEWLIEFAKLHVTEALKKLKNPETSGQKSISNLKPEA